MSSYARAAARDYNSNIIAIRDAAIAEYLDTIVSVNELGVFLPGSRAGQIRRAAFYSSVTFLKPLDEDRYAAEGGTPLFDAVGDLIEGFEEAPDKNDPNVSFLVMAVTDGEENASSRWNATKLARKIQDLQRTDRWTFVFRVPKGATRQLERLGIPEGNIYEWDTSTKGMEQATKVTQQAIRQYYTGRASGQRSTQKFYADLSSVTDRQVKSSMKDISSEVTVWPVGAKDDKEWIQHFVERRLPGESYLKGAGFYQMNKPETIQDHKRIMIRDKKTGAVYEGYAARQMLGLPDHGHVRVRPGDFGQWDLFIQSTSCNRHLVAGTQLIYWKQFMRAAA
jgi:hypothetical protein